MKVRTLGRLEKVHHIEGKTYLQTNGLALASQQVGYNIDTNKYSSRCRRYRSPETGRVYKARNLTIKL